jgi:predicted  nucleic acid-binding Zn-ribbon protein
MVIINDLIRSPEAGPEDHLELTPGVNVLVGPPNSGKTKWLQMIDFVFGNDESALDAFGDTVAAKYTSIVAKLTVAGESWTVERRWDEGTPKSRVFLNEQATNVKDFLHRLLSRLEIPVLHYPQGNPYGQRSWPELGWRSLYRHMYRRQHLWGDIADKQPESEQHACIVQFSGLAEHLFSDEYGQLVDKEKAIIELRAQKDQYMSVLSQVSKELLSAEEIGVGITPQSLEAARCRIESAIERLEAERQAVLNALAATVKAHGSGGTSASRVDDLSEEITRLENRYEELQLASERHRTRLLELTTYRKSVEQECERLQRALKAGEVLADLKVTHCPACDRAISSTGHNGANCYLCQRPVQTVTQDHSGGRLELESDQAKAVLAEATEMTAVSERDGQRIESEMLRVRDRIDEVRRMLRPVRSAAAAVLPPEIGVIDMKVGQLQEQLAQLQRVKHSLAYREVVTQQIEKIQQESAALEEQVARQAASLDFERAGDRLQDGMNTYLNAIAKAASWSQREVRVRIDEKRVRLLVGDRKWLSQLGGTLSLYFLISYHYALMCLAREESCHFPGFLAIDFPAELEDGSSIRDKENFVVEPFCELLKMDGYQHCQMIASGVAFENLEGANRIQFSKVWK